MPRITIDGATHTGCYRCECECGEVWNGQGEPISVASWSPALAVAESVVHHKGSHGRADLSLDLSQRFRDWLEVYWVQASARRMPNQSEMPGTPARRKYW